MTAIFGSDRHANPVWRLRQANWAVLVIVAMLTALGIATLYSVEGGSFQPWAQNHGLRYLIGMAFVLVMLIIPVAFWGRAAAPVYLAALVLLMLVPVMGTSVLGARRWLTFAGLNVQPAEVMKVALVLALARYYEWLPRDRVSDPLWVALPLVMIVVPVAFTLRQPDLGSALLYATVGLSIMFLAGVSVGYFIAGGIAVAFAGPVIWSNLYDYQRRRIEVFLDPEIDPLGAGYHIAQSKIALGAGGVSGKGYMQGTQSQLDFLPEKHTDFIFPMFAEEWGFVGAMGLLALYVALLTLLASMALRASSKFCRLLIAGAWVTIFLYVFVNMAMVTGLVPVVGIPLPFVSYGGTSMLTLMAGLGLALAAGLEEQARRDGSPAGSGRWGRGDRR